MDKTFLFYDIETTGLNKCFDQILQFAAIRTDLQLNELERHEILVKLNPDVIPSPTALLTHGISIHDMQNGLPEIEAIQHIHQLMNTPGTISLGYNTLGFDDEFLRFSFFRNLLPPYTHQWDNDCSRADIYPMVVMYYLYKKELFHWPERNGKISFKLADLNASNHFADGRAHHAMGDVEVTLALAKQLQKEPSMWDFLLGFFIKDTEQKHILQLPIAFEQHREGIMIDTVLGHEQHFQCPALAIGQHYHYRNQTLWLRLDTSDLTKTITHAIAETTWVFRKRLGEPGWLLPPIARFNQLINKDRQDLATENKKWLMNNTSMRQAIFQYHLNYKYPKVPYLDAGAALYEMGFMQDHDVALCKEFHRTTPEKKTHVISKFSNPILQEQAIRIMGRHYQQHLSPIYLERYQKYLTSLRQSNEQTIPRDYRSEPRLTLAKALAETDALLSNHLTPSYQEPLLKELQEFLG